MLPAQLTCMVLGRSLPEQFVVTGHLLPLKAKVRLATLSM